MIEGYTCYEPDRIATFPTLEEALSNCTNNKLCSVVHEPNCDRSGNAFTCMSPNLQSLLENKYQCVFWKTSKD